MLFAPKWLTNNVCNFRTGLWEYEVCQYQLNFGVDCSETTSAFNESMSMKLLSILTSNASFTLTFNKSVQNSSYNHCPQLIKIQRYLTLSFEILETV